MFRGNYSGQGTSLAPGYSGASSCTTALNGYYSNGTISVNGVIEPASEQIPCPAGTYQPYVAQSSCIDASAGFYANGTQGGFNVASTVTGTSENQERCYEGTWQNQTGQASCHLAESGYYSIGTQTYNGSVTYLSLQQVPCPAGTYSNYLVSTPGIDRVSCTDVDAGYYSNGTVVVNGVTQKATEMTPCPAGTFQDLSGQASCNNAPAGYYSLGTHTPSSGILTPATEPTQCAAGTYQPLAGQDDCVDASVGYYSPGTSYSATSGYYNATSQVPCEAGTFSAQATALDTGLSGATGCVQAQDGYYSPGTTGGTGVSASVTSIASNQVPCPAEHTVHTVTVLLQTELLVQTLMLVTIRRYHYCKWSSTDSDPQNACDVGSYQANTGQSSCTETDAGYYQDQTAQSSQKACAAGNYQSATGATSCTNTDPGYYSRNCCWNKCSIRTNPMSCRNYQALSTQSSCDDADAGNYSLGTYSQNGTLYTATVQTSCDYGTYQPNTAQSECIDADAGYFVDLLGQSAQLACSAGTYQSSEDRALAIMQEQVSILQEPPLSMEL